MELIILKKWDINGKNYFICTCKFSYICYSDLARSEVRSHTFVGLWLRGKSGYLFVNYCFTYMDFFYLNGKRQHKYLQPQTFQHLSRKKNFRGHGKLKQKEKWNLYDIKEISMVCFCNLLCKLLTRCLTL